MSADFFTERGSDGFDGLLVHTRHIAKSVSNGQANTSALMPKKSAAMLRSMMTADEVRPFADIAERLKWHRNLMGLSQGEYAEKIGKKRSALSLWEAGTHRLSLDGALSIRQTFGVSLDFLYEGIADALPMTLRNAWIDRPSVKS